MKTLGMVGVFTIQEKSTVWHDSRKAKEINCFEGAGDKGGAHLDIAPGRVPLPRHHACPTVDLQGYVGKPAGLPYQSGAMSECACPAGGLIFIFVHPC